ncbi:sulfite exporter TauE/SafE family protein [Corynebacterium sp. 335C]
MEFGAVALVVILAVVLVGALLQRVSGMGLGLIGAPVLSLLVGPVAGVLIINVLAAVNAVFQSWSVREHIEWRRFWLIGPVMIVGSIPGAWVVMNTSTPVLQILIGGLVLLGLGVTTFRRTQRRVDGAGYALAAGAAGGFMNTLAGIAGPAITVYAQAAQWQQRTFSATLQPLFFVSGVVSLATKGFSGGLPVIMDVPWYVWPAALLCMLAGIVAGTRIARRVPMPVARRIALGLAASSAAVTLVRGLTQLA